MPNENVKLDRSATSTLNLTGSSMEQIPLSILIKFIKPYNGDRDKLSSFIKNCENAINLANLAQTDILFKYIVSQLEGKAESASSLKIFNNWNELKQFLKITFGETKHRDHLLLDLQNCKPKSDESVTQYSLRLETCLTKLQTDIKHSTRDESELKGRIASTEDLALHTFMLGLPNSISIILRCRNPTSLHEAISLAVQEEKLQNYVRSNISKPSFKSLRCKICNKSGHNEKNCYSNRKHSAQSPVYLVDNPNPSISQSNDVTCRYCKNIGHDISECRKRQYNNSRKNNNKNYNNSQKQIHNVDEVSDGDANDNTSEPDHSSEPHLN